MHLAPSATGSESVRGKALIEAGSYVLTGALFLVIAVDK